IEDEIFHATASATLEGGEDLGGVDLAEEVGDEPVEGLGTLGGVVDRQAAVQLLDQDEAAPELLLHRPALLLLGQRGADGDHPREVLGDELVDGPGLDGIAGRADLLEEVLAAAKMLAVA